MKINKNKKANSKKKKKNWKTKTIYQKNLTQKKHQKTKLINYN